MFTSLLNKTGSQQQQKSRTQPNHHITVCIILRRLHQLYKVNKNITYINRGIRSNAIIYRQRREAPVIPTKCQRLQTNDSKNVNKTNVLSVIGIGEKERERHDITLCHSMRGASISWVVRMYIIWLSVCYGSWLNRMKHKTQWLAFHSEKAHTNALWAVFDIWLRYDSYIHA